MFNSRLFSLNTELSRRLWTTLLVIFVFRMGTFITLPGIDVNLINKEVSGLLGLLDIFLGGAFSNVSIFGLGIMPYINASIIMQLLTLMFPRFQKIQKEGRSGRMRLHLITKILTLIIATVQAVVFLSYGVDDRLLLINRFWFTFLSLFILVAGTMVCVWLGDKITDEGVGGSGVSMLIMVGIVSSLPSALIEEYNLRVSSPLLLFIEFLLLCLVVSCTIMLNHAVRKIPLQYAREFTNTYFTISRRQYLPLKLISSGVMPIIFAQVMMFVFGFIFQLLSSYSDLCVDISRNLSESTSWSYNILFALLIILFSYMYVAININPMKVAEDMKHSSSFIPGIRPGKPTADYIDNMLSKLTLPGSILLACLAMLPALAYSLGICRSLSRFYGGSSLLILVSVIVECSQQIKSYLLLYRYDHIMDSGEIPTIS